MKEKGYAVVALKYILHRALGAAEAFAVIMASRGDSTPSSGTSLDFGDMDSWDLEFAQMPRDEQAEWLLHLFDALVEYG